MCIFMKKSLLTPLFGLSQITELYSDHFPKLVQTIKDMSDEKTRIVLAFGAFFVCSLFVVDGSLLMLLYGFAI